MRNRTLIFPPENSTVTSTPHKQLQQLECYFKFYLFIYLFIYLLL